MAGKIGRGWRRERQDRKNEYIENLDSVLKLYTSECLEEVSLTESFEGQLRMLKLLTETGSFMKDLSSQLDDIQFELERLNRRLFNENNKKLEVQEEK